MAKVKRTCKVSGGSLPKGYSHTLNVEIDYTGVDASKIMDWATGERIIALQRVLRSTNPEFLEKLPNPYKVHANVCGHKVTTPEERIAELVEAGFSQKMAEMVVYDPAKMAELEKMLK